MLEITKYSKFHIYLLKNTLNVTFTIFRIETYLIINKGSSHRMYSINKAVLKNFGIFKEEQLWRSLFLTKLQVLRLGPYYIY